MHIMCKFYVINDFCFPFRGGKAPLYDKMVQRNDSIVRNVSKEEWRTKDIVECIFDDTDSECNLQPGTLADLAMVRNEILSMHLV
jgi:hypothetical protein